MKVFLSYQFKDNISKVINLLSEQGIEVIDSMTDVINGRSYHKAIKKLIETCDFVIIIYTSQNPNIAFEAGIAVSSNKPIFAIISEIDKKPFFLLDSTYVHALPNELDKIKFNLDIFLNKLKPRKKIVEIQKDNLYGDKYFTFYTDIVQKFNQLNKNSELSYQILFKEIFEKYNLNVIQEKNSIKSKFYTDFCIWSDNLNNVLGNPILVEIKKEISKKTIKKFQETINKLVVNNAAECTLIFYDNLIDLDKKELPNTSKYLFIQISDLIEKLAKSDFNNSIRQIRNDIIHNK